MHRGLLGAVISALAVSGEAALIQSRPLATPDTTTTIPTTIVSRSPISDLPMIPEIPIPATGRTRMRPRNYDSPRPDMPSAVPRSSIPPSGERNHASFIPVARGFGQQSPNQGATASSSDTTASSFPKIPQSVGESHVQNTNDRLTSRAELEDLSGQASHLFGDGLVPRSPVQGGGAPGVSSTDPFAEWLESIAQHNAFIKSQNLPSTTLTFTFDATVVNTQESVTRTTTVPVVTLTFTVPRLPTLTAPQVGESASHPSVPVVPEAVDGALPTASVTPHHFRPDLTDLAALAVRTVVPEVSDLLPRSIARVTNVPRSSVGATPRFITLDNSNIVLVSGPAVAKLAEVPAASASHPMVTENGHRPRATGILSAPPSVLSEAPHLHARLSPELLPSHVVHVAALPIPSDPVGRRSPPADPVRDIVTPLANPDGQRRHIVNGVPVVLDPGTLVPSPTVLPREEPNAHTILPIIPRFAKITAISALPTLNARENFDPVAIVPLSTILPREESNARTTLPLIPRFEALTAASSLPTLKARDTLDPVTIAPLPTILPREEFNAHTSLPLMARLEALTAASALPTLQARENLDPVRIAPLPTILQREESNIHTMLPIIPRFAELTAPSALPTLEARENLDVKLILPTHPSLTARAIQNSLSGFLTVTTGAARPTNIVAAREAPRGEDEVVVEA